MPKSCFTSLPSISLLPFSSAGKAYRSDSPIHLLTKSELDTLKNVLAASVATAFAK
jgi:hypothetical protein